MRRDCKQIWNKVVDHVLGESNPEAASHLAECQACRSRVEQFDLLLNGLSEGAFDASKELISAAKAIMPSRKREVFARLVNSSRALAGVRGPDADIQALYEAEGERLRVQYRPSGRGWEVLGQAPGASGGEYRGKSLPIDPQGRFLFKTDTLSKTGFRLQKGDLDIVVPSVKEILRNDS